MTKIHPVRATLAVGTLVVTAYLLVVGIDVPDAWWTFLGGIGVFYFTTKED